MPKNFRKSPKIFDTSETSENVRRGSGEGHAAPFFGEPPQRRARDPKAALYEDDEEEQEEDVALIAWRTVRDRAPSLLTGAGPADGEADPAAALFNTFVIRLPFLLLLGALLANVLLGGGLAGYIGFAP